MTPDFKLGLLIGALSVVGVEMWVLILAAWRSNRKKRETKQ